MDLLTASYALLFAVEVAALVTTVPFHLHMLLAAVACIYIGAHFSLQTDEVGPLGPVSSMSSPKVRRAAPSCAWDKLQLGGRTRVVHISHGGSP
jgi:hypothetical protein